jgi:hypothetical protein
VIIVGVRVMVFGVRSSARCSLAAAFIALGAVAFLSLGYVLASFTKTRTPPTASHRGRPVPDDVPLGVFFPIAAMPPSACRGSPGWSR